MRMSKRMAAGTAAASMGIGGLVGAAVLAPAVSGAQAGDASSEASVERAAHPRAAHGGIDIAPLDEVAETIGTSSGELRQALGEGQTVAEVAEANGVDPDTVVDALVAGATERLEQGMAELPERMEGLVNGDFDRPVFAGHGRHHHGPPSGAVDEPPDGAS